MTIGKYEECRSKVRSGDLVYFSKGRSIASKLTQLVTRSEYFHVGIAFWIHDPEYKSRLMIVEAHAGGRRIVTLSAYIRHPMSIISFDNNWSGASSRILDNTGLVPYSYGDYIGIGLRELFAEKFFTTRFKSKRGQVCSELVAEYLYACNIKISDMSSPGSQFRELIDLGLSPTLNVIL